MEGKDNLQDYSSTELDILDNTLRALLDAQTLYQLLLSKGIVNMKEIGPFRDYIIDNTETGAILKRVEKIIKEREKEST